MKVSLYVDMDNKNDLIILKDIGQIATKMLEMKKPTLEMLKAAVARLEDKENA